MKPRAISLRGCETSVKRQKYLVNGLADVFRGAPAKFNGIAAVEAGQLPICVSTTSGDMFVWMVADRPLADDDAHAGLQIARDGEAWDQDLDLSGLYAAEDLTKLKKALSDQMRIVVYPEQVRMRS